MRKVFTILIVCLAVAGFGQTNQNFIRVNFLYGSKPIRKFKDEPKYMGGLHGGHVTIDVDSTDCGFAPKGKLHVFAHKKSIHSSFGSKNTHGKPGLWDGYKYASVTIPVTQAQHDKIVEILSGYCGQTPYDYAFFGMRCASATRDILGQVGIMGKHKRLNYILTTFYPKKLRKRLFRLAEKHNWYVIRQDGRTSRKWEKD